MSQTILIEPDIELQKVLSMNLNAYTGTDVIERSNALEAIELLKILPQIDLIVTRVDVKSEATANAIFDFLRKNKQDIPMIVLGHSIHLEGDAVQLKEPIVWETVIKNAGQLLGINENDIRGQKKPNFVSVPLSYFYEIDHTPCDVYLRIKSSPGAHDFSRKFSAQESFTVEDIQKYQKQGVQNFYISKDYHQYFVTYVTNSIISKLELDLDFSSRLTTNARGLDIVKEHVQRIGITDEISELAESQIQSIIQSIKESPELGSLLKVIFTSKISYAYQKAHLVCTIGNFIMSKQKWYEEKFLEMFTYVAFFSDITLRSAAQLKINTQSELEFSNLTQQEKAEVFTHAQDAARLITEFPKSDEYMQMIVTQHQGSLDGIGLPKEPDSKIHPLAKVFIISDAFVKIMLDPEAPKSKREILSILYMNYTEASFQKIIKTLEQKIE